MLEDLAIRVAEAAAELIRRHCGQAMVVGVKSSSTDAVTQTDIDAERLIRDLLIEATPEADFYGEEGGLSGSHSRLQWIIDPLDGTINFLYALPVFAVSVAAAFDGEVVAGAVVDVLRQETFSAHKGGGSRSAGVGLSASLCTDLHQGLIATGFSYNPDIRRIQGEIVYRVLPSARDIRCFGSAALQLCWVGAGRLDGYYERDTKLWDYAAGSLVASEAGATVELPCPENDSTTLAAAAAIFEPMQLLICPA